MSKIKLQETLRFHMDPDMYDGPECNQMRPRWYGYAEGDMDGDHQDDAIVLHPRRFPPGTRISVKEPVCPKCDEPREPILPEPETGSCFPDKCRCGFDWSEWVANEYS